MEVELTSDSKSWVAEELFEITEDIKWFEAGAKLLSPSGVDITEMKLDRLKERKQAAERIIRSAD